MDDRREAQKKLCIHCGRLLSWREFPAQSLNPDRLFAYCYECELSLWFRHRKGA